MDPLLAQEIRIPWDSEGPRHPTPMKRIGRLRDGFRVLRCRILAGRGPTVSVPGWARRMPFEVELNSDCKVLVRNVATLFSVAERSNQSRRMAFLRFHVPLALAWPPAGVRPAFGQPQAGLRPSSAELGPTRILREIQGIPLGIDGIHRFLMKCIGNLLIS